MTNIKIKDYTGYSDSGLEEAINDALQKAGDYIQVKVVETRSSYCSEDNKHYQVTLTTTNE